MMKNRSFSLTYSGLTRLIAISILIMMAFSIPASACYYYIGDYVWEDSNANGIKETTESGIPGVLVELYKKNNTGGWELEDTYTTLNYGYYSGYYFFEVEGDETYKVKFNLKSGYVFSPRDQVYGHNEWYSDCVDSDADPTTGETIEITSRKFGNTWDAGMYKPTCIGDFVWEDLNADGVQDAGEPGIPGVKVELYKKYFCKDYYPRHQQPTFEFRKIAETTTDSDGYYKFERKEFEDIETGTYYVKFYIPDGDGWNFTSRDAGTNESEDSDAKQDGTTDEFNLGCKDSYQLSCDKDKVSCGECNLDIDAGLYRKASVGDFVWYDSDTDGIQDEGEPAISGVTVELYSCEGGDHIASTTTDDSGFYEFTNLLPGSYYLKFISPVGYSFAPTDAGDGAEDSDADVNGITSCFDLAGGDYDHTIDAGLYNGSTEIPEFPSIALPMIAVIGLAFVFRRKNE